MPIEAVAGETKRIPSRKTTTLTVENVQVRTKTNTKSMTTIKIGMTTDERWVTEIVNQSESNTAGAVEIATGDKVNMRRIIMEDTVEEATAHDRNRTRSTIPGNETQTIGIGSLSMA